VADYTEAVRKMKTSELVLCLARTESLDTVIDANGALREVLQSCDVRRRDREIAEEEYTTRSVESMLAIAAEIDRRIPIPEGP
jgi:hypothetical protein